MNTENCIDPAFSSCTIWDGPDIPCLKICKGQTISKIVNTIATKLCEVLQPFDLSNLTIQCALDIFNKTEPTERTLLNILQLLVDNDCGLKQLIDGLRSELDGLSESNFIINLKCLNQTDTFGNNIEIDRDSTIQLIINEICEIKNSFTYVNSKLISLQQQIDAIDVNPVYNEPTITTCIDNSDKPVSEQVKRTATEFCNYRTLIGNNSDIATARSKTPSDLNLKYGTEPGWIPSPQNLLHDLNNLNIIIGKLIEDNENFKTNCCGFDCDDIKIGFGIESTDDGIVLVFTSTYGNKIPEGFIDNGSLLTITQEGNINIVNSFIDLKNNYSTNEISLTGFEAGKDIVMTLEVKLKNEDGTKCERLITKTYKYTGQCCVITNVGGEDAAIIYETIVNSSNTSIS